MVLPAKSIICMPCHAATFAVGDTITVSTLLFFVMGLLGVGSIWLSGGNNATSYTQNFFRLLNAILKAVFFTRFIAITKSLVMDGLVQRRLFRVSRERWVLHAMIFYPFVFRFLWGLPSQGRDAGEGLRRRYHWLAQTKICESNQSYSPDASSGKG